MTERILRVDYRLSTAWALPILAAVRAHPTLATLERTWRDSKLSDLAFAIETRQGALQEIVRQLSDLLLALSLVLPEGDVLERHLSKGAAYTFKKKDRAGILRLLIAIDSFISESRSLFENLAHFYRLFLKAFFGETVSEVGAFKFLASLFRDPALAERLRVVRHDIRHQRAPWLRFRVTGDPPLFEPELELNWRPEASDEADFVRMKQLAEISGAIWEAALDLQAHLVARVNDHRQP